MCEKDLIEIADQDITLTTAGRQVKESGGLPNSEITKKEPFIKASLEKGSRTSKFFNSIQRMKNIFKK